MTQSFNAATKTLIQCTWFKAIVIKFLISDRIFFNCFFSGTVYLTTISVKQMISFTQYNIKMYLNIYNNNNNNNNIYLTAIGLSPGGSGYLCFNPRHYCGHLQAMTQEMRQIPSVVRVGVRTRLKYDGTRAENRFRLSAKLTSPFKSAGMSVPSTTGSRGVCISGSNAGYTMFRGSAKGTGYLLHSPVSPSLPPPLRHRVPSHFNWTLLPRFAMDGSRIKQLLLEPIIHSYFGPVS
jgi:hypothetical protein